VSKFYVYRDSGNPLPEGCEGTYAIETIYNFSGDYHGDLTVIHESQAPVDISRKKILDGALVDMTEAEAAVMDAAEAQATVEAEAARGEALAATIGTKVQSLVSLLASFGLVMPLEFDEAFAVIHAQSNEDSTKTANGTACLALYSGLTSAGFTDRDIYLVAQHLGLTQETEA
jgi:hypothetical protein